MSDHQTRSKDRKLRSNMRSSYSLSPSLPSAPAKNKMRSSRSVDKSKTDKGSTVASGGQSNRLKGSLETEKSTPNGADSSQLNDSALTVEAEQFNSSQKTDDTNAKEQRLDVSENDSQLKDSSAGKSTVGRLECPEPSQIMVGESSSDGTASESTVERSESAESPENVADTYVYEY